MIIKLAFAFGAGFISFLTPCVLPIIPGYISYITGKNLSEIERDKKTVLIKTILFSLGFSLVFIALGITASTVGNILLFFSNELRIGAGIIIILFSLQMLGFFNFKILNQEKRIETKNYKNNYAFPFLVGTAFAFGWTPCIGPVLGSILALSAAEASISKGVLLLSFYSLGLSVGIAIILMVYFKVMHPPAASNPLVALSMDLSFDFILFPVVTGAIVIIIMSILINRIILKRNYPTKWF